VKIEEGEQNEIHKKLTALETVEVVDFVAGDIQMFEVQSHTDQSSRKEIFRLCVENKWILTEMSPVETKLEDVFRELTMN
jgi:ABC-2 type transport system ATP-binding protein